MAGRLTLAACAGWLVLYELRVVLWPSLEWAPLTDRHAHLVVLAAACAALWAAALRQRDGRLGWCLLAAGASAWAFGETYFAIRLWDLPAQEIPVPSPADFGYLALAPLAGAGLLLLARRHIDRVDRVRLVDGLTAALAIAAVSCAYAMGAVTASAEGSGTVASVVLLAYPIADTLLIGVVVGVLALLHWRVGLTWILVVTAFTAFWVVDLRYAVGLSDGSFVNGGPWDAGWWLLPVLLGFAARRPAAEARVREDADVAARTVVAPLAFALVSVGILAWAALGDVHLSAVVLGVASLLAVLVRLALTFRAHAAMVRRSRHEALTDALTGLGNRRALAAELEARTGEAGEPVALALFDLDGFKGYNDTFGHPAGDALLVRLGSRLADAMPDGGRAFRMGGDEFCAVLPPGGAHVERAAAALSERGGSFAVECSFGVVHLPEEAHEASEALRLADDRMYAHKRSGRASAGSQSKDVLVRALAERDPGLHSHLADVAGLAEGVARRLGLEGEEAERVRHAAELHDVGKVAIPDAILDKPSALSEAEWAFVREHTLIGERIVAAAPALGPVAPLVRASHERWDGTGYPDRLAGEAIPLGARIVSVCDAFDAMVADRPYRRALEPAAALEELRRCAGSQFDPRVVEAFEAAWTAGDAQRTSAPGALTAGAPHLRAA